MLRAIRYEGALRTGSGTPLLVTATDGRLHLVKLAGSGEGVVSLVVGWLGLGLARALELPVPPPLALRVGPDVTSEIRDPEVREMAERTPLPGLATRWLEGARPASAGELEALPAALRVELLLWDVLCLNADRTVENPNAVLSADGVCFVDYSAAVALRGIVAEAAGDPRRTGAGPSGEAAALAQLRRHPCWAPPTDAGGFLERVRGLTDDAVRRVVAGLPGAWLRPAAAGGGASGGMRGAIEGGVSALLAEAEGVLARRLAALAELEPEAPEARRERTAAARRRFTDRRS